ncbi:MAG: AMMECR1 domain-containing protein [Oleiphilus sp.]|nr:MAG: AMMECR1 domain-containing protein [Oleiphilus sp.]
MPPMPCTELSPQEQTALLALARQSINYGQRHPAVPTLQQEDYPPSLQKQGCCFVTLHSNGQLRGCIGALEPYQPLFRDVAEHAYAAAYQDPRFPGVSEAEIPKLQISISVLSAPSPIESNSETDLLRQIETGRDGIILEEHDARGRLQHKATYLPSVWEQLPNKQDFIASLKQKAGLPTDYWSDQLRFWRYVTHSFSE